MKKSNLSKFNMPKVELSLAEIVMAHTPKFFKTLRTIGLVIGLVGVISL